ncbi:MAG: antifreeze protein [Planctomycetaceae bacterium]|nr:antifreeze protein [Planctomycetaceae bacterium]
MGLFDKLKGELIDIIEWSNQPPHLLVWKFPRYNNEIKHGAQLIVRPGQEAIFVHEGQVADVLKPGRYELDTNNIPVLSTLQGWKHGFSSPFKCDVFFVSTRQATDLKWGTPNPIPLRDSDFGTIRIRAFGSYTLKVVDPKPLLSEMSGSQEEFDFDAVDTLLRNLIVQSFSEHVAESKIAVFDLAANYSEVAEGVRERVCEKIDDEFGLEIPQLMLVNVSFPEEVEKAIDSRSAMGAIGDMQQYQQYQLGKAMPDIANNPGGGSAADGMGLGMGLAMAGRMMNTMGQDPAGNAPPPVPASFHIAVEGDSKGPFQASQLSGQITPETLVWSQGMAAWTPAVQVPQLAGLFATPPPPPPPPAPPAAD